MSQEKRERKKCCGKKSGTGNEDEEEYFLPFILRLKTINGKSTRAIFSQFSNSLANVLIVSINGEIISFPFRGISDAIIALIVAMINKRN